jgi:HNH endonuclease
MHYSRWKTHGDAEVLGQRRQSLTCGEDGCDRRPLARDLCRKHYYATHGKPRERRPPNSHEPRPVQPVSMCSVAGCDEPASARGWCGAHYQRWRRFGDPAFRPPAPARVCTVEGCSEVPNARALCRAHYYRWWRYGDPLFQKNASRITTPRMQAPRPCLTCGQMYEPGYSAARKYCGKTCKPSGRIAGSVNKRTWVEKLGAEDGWRCWLCAEPVDPLLYWPERLAGSVDHVLPVSKGGTDERFNLKLAHLTCNVARKDKDIVT